MKTKHFILGTVLFGFSAVIFFNYLSSVLDAKRLEKIQLMQEKVELIKEKIDTEIVESYLTSQISKQIEI